MLNDWLGAIMKKKLIVSLLIIISCFIAGSIDYVKILTPVNGWTTDRIITISGETNVNADEVRVVFNSIPLRLPVKGGRFSRNFIAGPGLNNIYAEVQSKDSYVTDSVAFYSKAPAKAMKIILMWDTDGTDVDLHVVEPTGEECFYGQRETKIGGSLDVDITDGYGPEVYTLATPTKGIYKIMAHYYSDNGNPQSALTVYVVINEGTSNEKILCFESMLTMTGIVVNINAVTLD